MRVPHEALRQTISIEDAMGSGAYGSILGEPRAVPASVQHTMGLVTDEMGVQAIDRTMVIVRPEAGPILVGSRVTNNGETYRVVKAFPLPDDRSPSHWEVIMELWAKAPAEMSSGSGS